MREQYDAQKPTSMWLRMIAGGGGSGLTKEQPELNIVRGAYYALIGALSGAQTMALCSYDEAYTIPTEYSARISLRTMQLLSAEMGLCDTVDPLAGSYYVETLTSQMREQMEKVMGEIDAQGGIVKLISEGIIQSQLSAQAYERRREIESGEFPKVGTNCFQIEEEQREVQLHPYSDEDAQAQIAATTQVCAERDNKQVAAALAEVSAAAAGDINVMPAISKAVSAYATVGEITAKLSDVFGRYQEPIRF
jgi:methylmalonyl-CoA mutase N-terminal domain/subunit